MGGWPLGRPFLEELRDLDPLVTVKGYGGRVHVIHGELDASVPLGVGRRYAAETGADLDVIPGAGHTFDSLAWTSAFHEAASAFLLSER